MRNMCDRRSSKTANGVCHGVISSLVRPVAVVVHPLLSSIRRLSRRVARLVDIAIKERLGEDHSSSYFVIDA